MEQKFEKLKAEIEAAKVDKIRETERKIEEHVAVMLVRLVSVGIFRSCQYRISISLRYSILGPVPSPRAMDATKLDTSFSSQRDRLNMSSC